MKKNRLSKKIIYLRFISQTNGSTNTLSEQRYKRAPFISLKQAILKDQDQKLRNTKKIMNLAFKKNRSSDTLFAAANLLLPEVLVTYFELIKHQVKVEEIHFYFTELNNIPEEFKAVKPHPKGFFPEATVQDFPIRGKNV
jgi:hypothetical protein